MLSLDYDTTGVVLSYLCVKEYRNMMINRYYQEIVLHYIDRIECRHKTKYSIWTKSMKIENFDGKLSIPRPIIHYEKNKTYISNLSDFSTIDNES